MATTTHDWLPFNHEALHDKAQQTNNYLTDPMNRDRMGFGPGTPYGQWLDTHTPLTLEFEEHERGKTVYFCLRWENTRGEKGPWSEIQSAIIP